MRKKGKLIIEWGEHIPRGWLKSKDLRPEAKILLGKCGVYALYYTGKKPIYIGQGENVYRRLMSHLRNKENWKRFNVYLTKDRRFTKDLETLLIRIYPKYKKSRDANRQRGRFSTKGDLGKKLETAAMNLPLHDDWIL
jgi:hypothetical protein